MTLFWHETRPLVYTDVYTDKGEPYSGRRKHPGVSEQEKVPYSNIQANQLDLPLTCPPL